ncbi:hypothetical protein C2E31_09340 [Rhodopirellula baltica]|nr:hypothetical protein C2E31_09340 [Rhodopirellula baltica]
MFHFGIALRHPVEQATIAAHPVTNSCCLSCFLFGILAAFFVPICTCTPSMVIGNVKSTGPAFRGRTGLFATEIIIAKVIVKRSAVSLGLHPCFEAP